MYLKNCSQGILNPELMKTIENHIKLVMYNKTVIAQFGMCVVITNHKDNKKKCDFFCSSQEWPGTAGYARYSST